MMLKLSLNNEISLEQPDLPIRLDAKPDSLLTQIWRTIGLCLRKSLATMVTTLILLAVALPVILLMLPIKNYDTTGIMELFRYLVGIPVFAISIVALPLSAGQTFTFLHNRTAVDVYHALPLKRLALFAGRFGGGALVVLLPQFLAFTAVLLIRLLPGYQILDWSAVVQTAFFFMLISLALYAVSVLAFVLTGTLFDAMLLLLMLNVAYPGTLYTIDVFTGMVLPGFSMTNFVDLINIDRYLHLCPLGELLKVGFQSMTLPEVLWWIALVLLISIGSLLIYQRRPSELAGKPLAYRAPFLIVRFLACLVVGLVFGYLYYDLYATLPAFIFSAAVGSLAAHTLIEVVLSRGFRNYRRSLPSYGVFVLLFTVGCLIVTTGFFGYDTRLPANDKIIQARFIINSEDVYFFPNSSDHDLVFTDPANIANFLAMNQAWLQEMQNRAVKPYSLKTNRLIHDYANDARYTPYRLTYVLSSGRKSVRTVYFNFSAEPYASLYSQVRSTGEYKQQQYKALFKPDSELDLLTIYNKVGLPMQVTAQAQDKSYLSELLDAVKQDLSQNDQDESGGSLIGYLNLSVRFGFSGPVGNQGYTHTSQQIVLTDAFVNTLAVLDKRKLLDQLDADKNRYIAAYLASSNSGDDALLDKLLRYQRGPYCFPVGSSWLDQGWQLMKAPAYTKIADPDLIQFLYRAGQDVAATENGGYLVILAAEGEVKPDGSFNTSLPVLYLPADQVPEKLAGLLKK